MERMREHVEKVSKYFKQENVHAPIPGNSEPWWKTFINFEADLRVCFTASSLCYEEGVYGC